MDELQKHIRCRPGDVGRYVFIPGDQGRAKRIAERFENMKEIASNRAYVVYTGTLDGVPVSSCATGIGGPSASIAIEELARVGADCFIRVGSCGGRQKNMSIGSIAIAHSAYRGEGTSMAYAPAPFPAVADLDVTNALIRAAIESGHEYYTGTVFTRDAYYVQDRELNQRLTDMGVVASEQECSIAFILGSIRRLRVGAILSTDSNIWLDPQPTLAQKEELFKIGEKKAIDIAIEAMRLLISGGENR